MTNNNVKRIAVKLVQRSTAIVVFY